MTCKFKERILEEGVMDFAKQNPYLSLGVGGALAGTALNYFGDGAESLEASRKEDLEDWKNTDAREALANKITMDKDTYTDIRDPYYRLAHPDEGLSDRYIRGRTEDINLFDNPTEDKNNVINMAKENEKYNAVFKDGKLTIGGHEVGVGADDTSDKDYDNYHSGVRAQMNTLNDTELSNKIAADKALNSEEYTREADIKNAARDSYLQKGLGGAALGTAGVFAKRKLDEKKGY
jgi:hypothetical protein